MEFTKENVAKSWHILNHNSSQEDKKEADKYLYSFKKSNNSRGIIIELLQSQNESEKTFGSIILYQYIREHLGKILESKDLYGQYKDLLFNQLLLAASNFSSLIQDKIYSSTTLLLLIGLITYWPDGIDNMLQYANASQINCYITTIILANCKQELNDININQKQIYMIESRLIDKKEEIKMFINTIVQQSKTIKDQQFSQDLYLKVIELTKSWVKYELNILSLPQMTNSLLLNMNTGNMELLSELFEDSILYCKSAKIEKFQDSAIDEYVNQSNKEEMESISLLISIIKQYVMNSITNNKNGLQINKSEDIKIMHSLASIFSSLTENFIYLFFLKNNTSRDLLDLLYYFISYPNRAISSKFFEGINEMKIFINTEYKFSNLSNEEKVEFSNYLIRLNQAVMSNCKLKAFPELIKSNNNSSNQFIKSVNDQNEYEIANNEISINNYRSIAEDVFLNLFTIFGQNFKDEGAYFFLKNIIQILIDLNINDDSIITDTNRLLIVETVLFTVRNITECFEALNLDTKPLIEFMQYILNSKVICNENMIHSFILFLESTASYISYDNKLYVDINRFLINTAKYKPLEKISTIILLTVNDSSNLFSIEVVKLLSQFYKEQFTTLDTPSLCNVAESLCASVGILDKERKLISMPLEDLAKYYNEILQHAIGQIDLILQELKGKLGNDTNNISIQSISNITDLPKEISKLYYIITVVFKQINFLDSKDFLWEIFQYHFIQNYNNTVTIFNVFSNNTSLISQITVFYNKITSKIGSKCLSIFDQLSALMLNSYSSNPDNFDSLLVLNNLFAQAAPLSEEKAKYISINFFPLIHQICSNIMKNKKHQIESTSNFAYFFSNVLNQLVYAEFNDTNVLYLTQSIDLLIEVFKTIIENTLIKNTLKAFSAFINSKIIPVNVIEMKYNNIIATVLDCFEHFCSVTINQLVAFTSLCLRINSDSFLCNLKGRLEGEQYRMLKQEHVQLVIDYFLFSNNEEIAIKNILADLVNISKGMGQVDKLNHYAIEMSRAKISKA